MRAVALTSGLAFLLGCTADFQARCASDDDCPTAETCHVELEICWPRADTGAPDAAGTDAQPDPDAARPMPDTGPPIPDAEAPVSDTGMPIPDTEMPIPDAGMPIPDAGDPDPDAETPIPDTGSPDPDLGGPDPDAAVPDPDAAPPPRAPRVTTPRAASRTRRFRPSRAERR